MRLRNRYEAGLRLRHLKGPLSRGLGISPAIARSRAVDRRARRLKTPMPKGKDDMYHRCQPRRLAPALAPWLHTIALGPRAVRLAAASPDVAYRPTAKAPVASARSRSGHRPESSQKPPFAGQAWEAESPLTGGRLKSGDQKARPWGAQRYKTSRALARR